MKLADEITSYIAATFVIVGFGFLCFGLFGVAVFFLTKIFGT